MCIAIAPVEAAIQSSLVLVSERIYQRCDGSCEVTADFLLRNESQVESIQRIRIVVPYQLCRIPENAKWQEKHEEKAIARLKTQSLTRLNLQSHLFSARNSSTHWLYNSVIEHMKIDDHKSSDNVLTIRRFIPGNSKPMDDVFGDIKTGWKVEIPAMDNSAWFLLANTNTYAFDLFAVAEA